MWFDANLMKGSMEPVILRLLSEGEMYGYAMLQIVNERTKGSLEWKQGSLYPCLHRLEADGLLKSVWRDAPSGKSRKYYLITRRGRSRLVQRTTEWKEFARAINSVLRVSKT